MGQTASNKQQATSSKTLLGVACRLSPVALLIIFSILFSVPAFAEDTSSASPEDEARKVHKLASSDMIYSQEEVKALYYQNIEIINLLKDIRDLLQAKADPPK